MFLSEKDLKETFWKSYNRKNRAVRHQFECAIREGNADLVTVEIFQGNIQLNSFEFKLNDFKKVLLQAEENMKYVNKSWIVIPIEKEDLIQNKYRNFLDERKYIGVMGVEKGGRYTIIYQPKFQAETKSNQEIFKLLLNKI